MVSTILIEDQWLEVNEPVKGHGYRIHWVTCTLCKKEVLRYREDYKIDPTDWHKHYPAGIEVITFSPCEHHTIIKSMQKPEVVEYRVQDYYIIPK